MIRAIGIVVGYVFWAWAWAQLPDSGELLRAESGAGAAGVVMALVNGFFSLFKGSKETGVGGALLKTVEFVGNLGRTVADFMRSHDISFSRIWGLIRKFWDKVLLPLIQRLDRYILRFFKWLRDTFGPLIEALQWIRTKLLEFYTKWLRPIFDTIDVIRRILSLFSLFGLEWARRLDRALAELQAKIELGFLEVLGRVNEALDTVNRIVTLDGLLQRYTLIRSLIVHQVDALKVWYASIHKPLAGEKKAEYEKSADTRSVADVVADLRGYALFHSGPDVARIDEHVQDLLLRLGAQ